MMTASTPIPALSEGTTAAIANIVEYAIQREYGHTDARPAYLGARTLALAGLQLDLHEQFIGINGNDNGLAGYAESTLRMLVRDGMEDRRCQCHKLNGVCQHGTAGHCERHHESDVPPIDGARLCGTCHIAVYQARNDR